MKKTYFISWVGAISTFILSILVSEKVTKKYGQPVKKKNHITFDKIMSYTEKALKFAIDKI